MGKITRKDGFITSDKDLISQKASELPKLDIKNFGIYNLYSNLLSEEIGTLKSNFKDEVAEIFHDALGVPISHKKGI
jgi:hypothetical protein